MPISRRNILKSSAGVAGIYSDWSYAVGPSTYQKPIGMNAYNLARYETYWQKVAKDFTVDPGFINLENGYYGIMPDPIYREYQYQTRRLNLENSHFLRTEYKPSLEKIRVRLAKILGAETDEIAITRGGTEALQNLITGYNRLRLGDTILYSNLDYYSCRYAMEWLKKRYQLNLMEVNIPEPANIQNILDTYEQAFQNNRKIQLVLLELSNN
ncbi:MAG: aminotransferase class V-fold PLP-dependent enzyme [Oligoflexales bacterium]